MKNSIPDGWEKAHYQPLERVKTIRGGSLSGIYALIHAGELKAVKLAGKTMVTTKSLLDFLAKAEPWKPDRERVSRAVAARSDVIAKRAREAAEATRKTTARARIAERAAHATRAPPRARARTPP